MSPSSCGDGSLESGTGRSGGGVEVCGACMWAADVKPDITEFGTEMHEKMTFSCLARDALCVRGLEIGVNIGECRMLTPHRSPMANRGLRVYTCKFCVHRRSMTLGSQDGREDRAYEA